MLDHVRIAGVDVFCKKGFESLLYEVHFQIVNAQSQYFVIRSKFVLCAGLLQMRVMMWRIMLCNYMVVMAI